MKRIRPRDDDDDGLDALLDTMTNVVGILVLVLIVTQMGVADVITKIKSEKKIDAEQVDSIKRQLVMKEIEQVELHKMLVDPVDIDPERLKAEVDRQKELLERRKKLLAQKSEEQNQFSIKIAKDKERAAENLKLIADAEQKRKELKILITASLQTKANLEARLDNTPTPTQAPADIAISVPNPRPAPKGGKQVQFICANNRLYPININRFREDTKVKSLALIEKFKLNRDPAKGIDVDRFTKRYTLLKQQDDFVQLRYYVHQNRFPRFEIVPRQERGATVRELKSPRSKIRSKWLSQIDPAKHYGRFFVKPDSYEVYLATRKLFDDAEVLAGWVAVPQTWQYTSAVPGGIELGPPIEKKPPPTTPPAKPKAPANVID